MSIQSLSATALRSLLELRLHDHSQRSLASQLGVPETEILDALVDLESEGLIPARPTAFYPPDGVPPDGGALQPRLSEEGIRVADETSFALARRRSALMRRYPDSRAASQHTEPELREDLAEAQKLIAGGYGASSVVGTTWIAQAIRGRTPGLNGRPAD